MWYVRNVFAKCTSSFYVVVKKVKPAHGTPPATGIASFRSTTTKYNVLLKGKTVKWIYSGMDSLCGFICGYTIKYKVCTFIRLIF